MLFRVVRHLPSRASSCFTVLASISLLVIEPRNFLPLVLGKYCVKCCFRMTERRHQSHTDGREKSSSPESTV
jgi:hypothetical protein